MKFSNFRYGSVVATATVVSMSVFAFMALANHSWGGYHWARTTSPFTLKIGDNVTSVWDSYLVTISANWSLSSVLDATIVSGASKGNCQPTKGRVEVCNKTYGNNGWLGIASIWASGTHITQGSVKMNDTYFNTAHYNTSAWKNLVMCQEVGHTLGLDHQDEIFDNPNLGTCMDYTNDPDGTINGQLDNQFPNAHDYEELGIIYGHLDGVNTFSASFSSKNSDASGLANNIDTSNPSEWGQVVRTSHDGHSSLYERDFGGGHKVFTFVVWAN